MLRKYEDWLRHFHFLKYDEIGTVENRKTPIENINIWVKYFKYFSKPLLGHEQWDYRIR